MKKITLLFVFTLVVLSCKQEKKKEINVEKFPKELSKVFEKHGGIEAWRKQKVLSFNKGEEAHTVDLHSRKTVITSPTYSYGFDGENIWVSDTTVFKKDPKFYYNLYFYFYAMPFVLADDGIVYSDANEIEYKGKKYPGIKISYKANVGTSPDDNYYLYYNPDTYKMEWLRYSVTYFSKKPSNKTNLIKYEEWINVNGFLLPKSLSWFKQDKAGNPIEPAGKPVKFTLPLLSQGELDDSFFKKPKE
ncbi:MAG: DUF6503 family protein [Flavobacteriaceae bacterium]